MFDCARFDMPPSLVVLVPRHRFASSTRVIDATGTKGTNQPDNISDKRNLSNDWGVAQLFAAHVHFPAAAGPIHDAAKIGDVVKVESLTAAGTPVNEMDALDKTALVRAIRKRSR